jgi:hypothetical protein
VVEHLPSTCKALGSIPAAQIIIILVITEHWWLTPVILAIWEAEIQKNLCLRPSWENTLRVPPFPK